MKRLRETRKLFAFLEAVEFPIHHGADGYKRIDLTFDCVDARSFENGDALDRNPRHLSMVRVMTTPKRLISCFGFQEIPKETAWFELTLEAPHGNPIAWEVSAGSDYIGERVRSNVVEMVPLTGAGSPLGLPNGSLLTRLERWCAPRKHAWHTSHVRSAKPTKEGFHIRVVDVGQACCAAIHLKKDEESPIVGYFDVGAPMFFHRHNFPPNFAEASRVPKKGFVVLSHWDFDHYSLAVTDLKALQRLNWYAPFQKVGPGAARLWTSLGHRLHFISANKINVGPGMALYKRKGPVDRQK